ncbi:hypothetical protein GCM10027160_30760 [Streptomyces calidiresistens]|uniref:Uncharacterized protein n=1 Tax=Streptomyces calidiresistens TaxID=1485586 RepID=A0A7W3T1H3_9ACTN|nr:hypothetical protein [Streptomyces calidiresistens]MBB0229187.1 hypothetical protein [Streptomyces calidiresistens]
MPDLRSRLRLCHPTGVALGAAGLLAALVWLGGVAMPVPVATGGDSTVQLRMIVVLAGAILVAVPMRSPMADWEAGAGPRARRVELTLLAVLASAGAVLVGVGEALVRSPESAASLLRAQLIWLSLAVVSARLLGGWSRAWVLPLATIFPLTYLGWDAAGEVRWWNWLWQPHTAAGCWALAAVSLTGAVLALWATPWRTRRLRGRPRRGRGAPRAVPARPGNRTKEPAAR